MCKKRRGKGKIKFNISIVTGVLLIVGIMSVATVSMILIVARSTSQATAEERFDLMSLSARERTLSFIVPALDSALSIAYTPGVGFSPENDGLDHSYGKLFSRLLENHRYYYSIYLGLSDGSFFQVIKAGGAAAVIEAHDAPPDTDIIIRVIREQEGVRNQTFTFFDSMGNTLAVRTEPDVSYDPRVRPWYRGAQAYDEPVLSDPYVFNSLGQPGITASCAFPDGSGVAGVDLTLTELSSFVEAQKISQNGGIALFTSSYDLIAETPGMSDLYTNDKEMLSLYRDSFEQADSSLKEGLLYRGEHWRITPNRELLFLSAAPLDDFMTSAYEMQRMVILMSIVILLVFIPLVIIWSKSLSHALLDLTKDAERIGRMIFDGELSVRTNIYEFHKLAESFGIMKQTISDRTESLHRTMEKLEMLVELTIAMSAENDLDKLSEMILSGAKKLTLADGGSLYLVNENCDALDFRIVLNDTMHFKQGGIDGKPVTMQSVPLYEKDGSENRHNVVTHAFHSAMTVNIPDAYESDKWDFSGTKAFDKENGYRSTSFLTVPLKPRGGGPVMGALQLINSIDPVTGNIIPFPDEWNSFIEALGSAAAVAVQNWKLMRKQKQLFDDLVRFVAIAIDAKSPYTGKHCERVTEISNLILDSVIKSENAPFENFTMNSPEEIREFNIAAWLHDSGKITTPEHIMDKATKLETVYDRIHEIRTRFEVLIRDRKIERHEAVINGMDPAEADRKLKIDLDNLYDDFAFIARCNQGSEFMEEENLIRLEKIAETTWLRHFDKRLGISKLEAERISAESRGDEDLPVIEKLISDKPEHIILHGREFSERFENDKYGIIKTAQKNNRGELHNLSVRKGTLNSEERQLVDQHVTHTIMLLEQLRFPDDLSRVPAYAGKHHECLDGSGYPRKLTAEDLSIPERIIAIADVFEALIAEDRPYKKGNKLSEAIEILNTMKKSGKIDPDLFDLLLSSGIYLKIAEKYMTPSNIDQVLAEVCIPDGHGTL